MNLSPKISIALCTFNGEKYLKRQLDSFPKQTLLPFELVACDDASSDDTCRILEDFSHTAPFPVRIVRNARNLGLRKNFSQAASLCQGDYVAFSDQDDIWSPDKLEHGIRAMQKTEQEYGTGIPLLVHSDLSLIDAEGHVTAPSCMKVLHMRHEPVDPLRTLLVRNFVFGCTSLCNRALIQESLPFPDVIANHDGWCALIAASRGKILFIPEPKVLYRQHQATVTDGAVSPYNIRLIIRRFDPSRARKTLLGLISQAEELERRLNATYCGAPAYLRAYIDSLKHGGLANAFKIVFLLKIHTQGFVPNVLFFYRIARGRYTSSISKCLPTS